MTQTESSPLAWPQHTQAMLPLATLVYVAWADGHLTRDEIDAVRDRLCSIEGLDETSTDVVTRWLNPGRPPTASELQALLLTIKTTVPQLKDTVEYSIADLAGIPVRGEATDVARARAAVADAEGVLGIAGMEAVREVLGSTSRPSPRGEDLPTPAFEPAALTRLLDAPYGDVRSRLRRTLRDPAFSYPGPLPKEEYRDVVFEWTRLLAEAGFGRLMAPREFGGSGDFGGFIAAIETMAMHDLSLTIKFGVQFGLFGGSVQLLGTRRHHTRYLSDIGTLRLPGCFAMTELGHGSNVWDLETTATLDPDTDDLVVHTPTPTARKEWIGNAAVHGRLATVFAQLIVRGESCGVHAVLVPIRDQDGVPCAGVTIEDCGEKEGLNGVDNGRLWFDNVRVPRDNLLDRYGEIMDDGTYESVIASPSRRFFTMLGTLVGGRISICGAALTAAKAGLAIAVRYGARRRQFGPTGREEMPILDYVSHQRRLMPRVAAAYAVDFAQRYLVGRFLARTEDDTREVDALAAGLKAYSTWSTIDTLQACREACGGQGYLVANRIPALKADSDIFATFEGDNTVLMQLVAKSLLTDFRDQFGDIRVWGIVRYVADRAATRVREMNPVVTRSTDEGHLRDPDFHQAAFEYREERLLASAARRLKGRIDNGMDTFVAFNECQDHLVAVGVAHVERVVYERFRAAVQQLTDPTLTPPLTLLRDLFAVWRLEADRAWFLEAGYFEAAKARAVRTLVTELCRQARVDAVALVDAFGIPDACLGAPIAFGIDPRATAG